MQSVTAAGQIFYWRRAYEKALHFVWREHARASVSFRVLVACVSLR